MNNYKGIGYKVTRNIAGTVNMVYVLYPGGPYEFKTIKAAKSFIRTVSA